MLALEVSRLTRSSAEWYQLLDRCGITDTLIADESSVYHPGMFDDRLLLGLKDTMSGRAALGSYPALPVATVVPRISRDWLLSVAVRLADPAAALRHADQGFRQTGAGRLERWSSSR